MRRLVLLGLLGLGVSACEEIEPIEEVEQPLCPERVMNLGVDTALAQRASVASALGSAPAATDGRQRVLVRFRKPGTLSLAASAAVPRLREDKVRRLGAQVKYHWPESQLMALSLSPEERARLAEDPEVLSISADREVYALGQSPLAPVQALLQGQLGERKPLNTVGNPSEYTWAVRMVQADKVWDPDGDGVIQSGAITGQGVKVCVIDSGIDPEHPEIMAAYAGGWDYIDKDNDPSDKDKDDWGGGHGTHVAGTIVAQPASGATVDPNDKTLSPQGMVGVAPGATLLVARVLDKDGRGSTSDVIEALKWCRGQGAKIASLSLGSAERSDDEEAAFNEALESGMLTIAASGNGGELATPETKTYPAAYASVIAVGAVDDELKHPTFSQGGPFLSLVAPGVSIYSTYPRGVSPYAELTAGGTFLASSALEYSPTSGTYEGTLVDCGLGNGLRSCGAGTTCEGFVAYVDRGDITFNEKVKNVVSQGARAVIIGNNDPEDDETLGFTLGSRNLWPPTTAVPTTSVSTIRAQLGSSVKLTLKGSDYGTSTGTSMATPHVAGVAALVWSARPNLTNVQVRDILERSAKPLGDSADPASALMFGKGLVQAKVAVDRAISENPQ